MNHSLYIIIYVQIKKYITLWNYENKNQTHLMCSLFQRGTNSSHYQNCKVKTTRAGKHKKYIRYQLYSYKKLFIEINEWAKDKCIICSLVEQLIIGTRIAILYLCQTHVSSTKHSSVWQFAEWQLYHILFFMLSS